MIANSAFVNRAALALIVLSCLVARPARADEQGPLFGPSTVAAPPAPADLPSIPLPVTGPGATALSPEDRTSDQIIPLSEIPVSRDWSIVTTPAGNGQDVSIPVRQAPENVPDLVPGGRSVLPGAGPLLQPVILPEMTPVRRPGTEQDFLETFHERVSYGFLASATWLDSFFGDERYDVEDNQSRFKFRYIAFREEAKPLVQDFPGGPQHPAASVTRSRMEYRPEIDFRLVLPQLKKKTYLMITGDPNEDIEMSSSPAVAKGSPITRPENRNVTTALQYFFRSTERRSYSVMSGAKFHNGKPILFLGPRARYLWHLASWDLRFTEELLWYTDTGWLSRSRLDFERSLGDLFFRSSLQGIWTQEKNGYPYALAFNLLQPLDRNRAISYEWVNSFQTRPTNELDEVLFVFRYRQRIWRDWLYLEIAPQERFPRDRSFHETPGIMFKLEMIIGDYRSFMF